MKKRTTVTLAALFLMVSMFFSGVAQAGPGLEITFVNKTDRKVFVAILTYGSVPHTKGWYTVEAGKSKTVKSSYEGPTGGSVGYYAEGSKKGSNKIYWRGKKSEEYSWLRATVHPTKAFDYSDGSDDDGVIDVNFRPIEKWNGRAATVNLTAK